MTTKPLSASLESHLDMAPADGTDISTLLYLYVFRCLTIQHPALASGLSLAYSVLSVYNFDTLVCLERDGNLWIKTKPSISHNLALVVIFQEDPPFILGFFLCSMCPSTPSKGRLACLRVARCSGWRQKTSPAHDRKLQHHPPPPRRAKHKIT